MDTSDPLVTVRLSDIQRIRDLLMRLREESPQTRRAWIQVAGLYERCAQQAKAKREESVTR